MNLLFATTVLFIGDSHSVGPFGWRLDENLRKEGLKVATYASCGSIAKWWTSQQKTTCGFYSNDINGNVTRANVHPTPKFQDLLDSVRPDAVIIELGANYVKTPSDEFAVNDLKNLLKMVKESGASCFWITPPDSRLYRAERPRLRKLIDQAVGNDCKIFESRDVTSYPETGGDGVHYWFKEGMPIARKWADSAFEAFKASK